jgi:type II secretory pathway pseudopilin PulG
MFKRTSNFTLLELMIVVFIIVVVTGITSVAASPIINQSKAVEMQLEGRLIEVAINNYYINEGDYPFKNQTVNVNGSYSQRSNHKIPTK